MSDNEEKKISHYLIADDSSINRMVIKILLEKNGFNVEEAVDGSEVINNVIGGKNYEIVWLDIQMPNIDGIKCTDILRNKLNYKGPIIGITSHADFDTIKDCLQVGMNHVVVKPISEDKLIECAKKFDK